MEMSNCCYMPKRYLIIILASIGMVIIHAQRVILSVTAVTILNVASNKGKNDVANLPSVNWSPTLIGLLQSIFYVGYFVAQIPGGILSQKFPCNRLFGGCLLVSCSLNLLMPVAINTTSFPFTALVRWLQGLSESMLYPSVYVILRNWLPPEEKSKFGSIVITGSYAGAVIGLPASGFLTSYIGWQYPYFVFGGLGLFFFIIWFYTTYESPSKHPYISKEELEYVISRQGASALIAVHGPIPWHKILTSLPFISLIICNFARGFIFYMLLTNEPAYLNVFGFSLAENGLYATFPHIFMVLFALFSGLIAHLLEKRANFSLTVVRKILTGLGFGIEAVCMLGLYFISNGNFAIVALTIGVGISGLTVSGWQISHLDLAPRYASVLVGITTASGTLAGIINPPIIAYMTKNQTVSEWQHVFLVISMLLTGAVLFYLIFGSAVEQPWAKYDDVELTSTTIETEKLKSESIMEGTSKVEESKIILLEKKPVSYGSNKIENGAEADIKK